MEQGFIDGAIKDRGVDNSSDMNETKIKTTKLNLYYGEKQAVKSVSMDIYANKITALIGPSGCGKSTLLRCFNRMNDLVPNSHVDGSIEIDGHNIYDPKIDVVAVRRKVGMVFQQPNPFPKSIYENISYAPLMHDMVKKGSDCDELVEKSLRGAGLWEEVKDQLQKPGTALSGGQQQRLCIARTIAVSPAVILMDEPTSALDPLSTQVIEKLMIELKEKYTIVVVTHNMQQAARVSDMTAFMYLGELIEYGNTEKFFVNPTEKLTEEYITGKMG